MLTGSPRSLGAPSQARERLDGDNMWQCPTCKRKVPATKRLTIRRCPNVLTLLLKVGGGAAPPPTTTTCP